RVHLRVIEHTRRAHEARSGEYHEAHTAEYEHQPVIAADASRDARELRAVHFVAHAGRGECQQEEIELLDEEAKRDHGERGTYPGEKGALVRGVVAVTADHGHSPAVLSGHHSRAAQAGAGLALGRSR